MRRDIKVMVIVKATKNSEAGVMPTEQQLTAMGAYNEELVKAGVILSGEGLHPTSNARRIHFNAMTRAEDVRRSMDQVYHSQAYSRNETERSRHQFVSPCVSLGKHYPRHASIHVFSTHT
jgi:hypothetical protein